MSDVINKIISLMKNIHDQQKLIASNVDPDAKSISDFIIVELEEIKSEVCRLINENAGQQNKIQQLKKQIGDESAFLVKNNVYYTHDGDGPFCPYCFDNRGKKIRVLSESSGDDSPARHFCRVCSSSYSE